MAGITRSLRPRPVLLAGVIALAVAVLAIGLVANRTGDDGGSGGDGSAAAGSPSAAAFVDPYGSRFPVVTRTAAPLEDRRLDLYVPRAESARRLTERYPLALLATDPGTSPAQYEQFAHDLASYGIAVVVADSALAGVVERVQAWSARIAADPTEFLHGSIGPRVAFLVTHGDRRVPEEIRSAVDAVVQVTPGEAAADTHAATLLVCAGTGDGGCPRVIGDEARFLDDAATSTAVTDEGVRGPRRLPVIDERRARVIASLARPAAWWLLAAGGDPVAERFVAERIPRG